MGDTRLAREFGEMRDIPVVVPHERILVVENNAGQMLFDVRYAVEGRVAVEHYGRFGGIIPTPNEILEKLKIMLDK